jgi:hypothetical protein
VSGRPELGEGDARKDEQDDGDRIDDTQRIERHPAWRSVDPDQHGQPRP